MGSSIATINSDGSGWTEVTAGDSIDLAPRWVPGTNALVFQSAGIGRNEKGEYCGRGPFAIHRLELESGEMSTLVEDENVDCLAPLMSSDGALYYIRRPFMMSFGRVSPFRMLLDLLLFPLRLIYAVFQYLNFFSMIYTGNPLTSAGNARQKQADVRNMMLWGNLENAKEAIKSAQSNEDAPALVPDSWELVRQDGSKQVLAKGVLHFDMASDGTLLYTDGSGIYMIDAAGRSSRLHKAKLVERVVALPNVACAFDPQRVDSD